MCETSNNMTFNPFTNKMEEKQIIPRINVYRIKLKGFIDRNNFICGYVWKEAWNFEDAGSQVLNDDFTKENIIWETDEPHQLIKIIPITIELESPHH